MSPKNPPYVIESSKKLPLLLRVRDVILTILVWILYLYFMRDFFAFCRDVIVWASNGFIDTGSYASFQQIAAFIVYFKIVVILSVLFIGWSVYNYLRFRNKKRRRPSPPVTIEQIAAKAHLNAEDLEGWQEAQTLVVHHDANGRLIDIVKQ